MVNKDEYIHYDEYFGQEIIAVRSKVLEDISLAVTHMHVNSHYLNSRQIAQLAVQIDSQTIRVLAASSATSSPTSLH